MKIFHKEADYAVRALIYLAMRENSETFVSATVLSKELGIPLNFLRRICSALIRAEFLQTREGSRGGVRLHRKPENINVLELMELFHGEPELSECTFRKALCPNRKTCVLRRRILKIEEKVKQEFKAITLRNLVDDVSAQHG